jgi:hypothetical protein
MVFVVGQALAGVPNVELVTFLCFVSGYLLGAVLGAVVAACGMGAHSLFNVMGTVVPPVWAAQVASYAIVGAAGGIIGPAIVRAPRRWLGATLAVAVGVGLTILYQVVVNLVSYVTFSSDVSPWVFIWSGIAFAAVQVAWNAGVFLVALPPTLRVLAPFRRELAARGHP